MSSLIPRLIATIQVGTFETINDLAAAVDRTLRRSDFAKDLMYRPGFTLASELGEINLYGATTAEILGRDDVGCGAILDIFGALDSMGAVKLPPEAGPQYRIQYPKHPLGKWWELMYMEPIEDSWCTHRVFGGGRLDNDPFLYAHDAMPDDNCLGGDWWMFGLRSSSNS